MATYGVPLTPLDDTDALRRRIDVLAACVDITSDAYQRVKDDNRSLAAEHAADQQTIRLLSDDLDGMHACNERLWADKTAALRKIDALERELREAAR